MEGLDLLHATPATRAAVVQGQTEAMSPRDCGQVEDGASHPCHRESLDVAAVIGDQIPRLVHCGLARALMGTMADREHQRAGPKDASPCSAAAAS